MRLENPKKFIETSMLGLALYDTFEDRFNFVEGIFRQVAMRAPVKIPFYTRAALNHLIDVHGARLESTCLCDGYKLQKSHAYSVGETAQLAASGSLSAQQISKRGLRIARMLEAEHKAVGNWVSVTRLSKFTEVVPRAKAEREARLAKGE